MNLNYDPKKALKLAIKAHGNQKYGFAPYEIHLIAVEAEMVQIMRSDSMMFYDKNLASCAAYLHDSLEDTGLTITEIVEEIGYPVAYLVNAVTDEEGKNRAERKALTYPKIRSTDKLAVALKLADRLANVRHCIRSKNSKMFAMYKKEQQDVVNALFRLDDGLTSVWDELNDLLECRDA